VRHEEKLFCDTKRSIVQDITLQLKFRSRFIYTYIDTIFVTEFQSSEPFIGELLSCACELLLSIWRRRRRRHSLLCSAHLRERLMPVKSPPARGLPHQADSSDDEWIRQRERSAAVGPVQTAMNKRRLKLAVALIARRHAICTFTTARLMSLDAGKSTPYVTRW